uniref:Uncharacterized protein n=1 Tax=Eutreptiella gymnastica TaxID=73025 RepID=A0A7S1JIE1_9EUGL
MPSHRAQEEFLSSPFDKALQKCVFIITNLLNRVGPLGKVRRFLNRPISLPGTNSEHYWGYFFLMQNFCLTALYTSLMLGYLFHFLRSIRDNPGHRYLFGVDTDMESMQFLSVALFLELLQDTLAHTLAYHGNRRMAVPCSMNAVFPGRLLRRGHLRDAVFASITPMCAVSMLSTYGYCVLDGAP